MTFLQKVRALIDELTLQSVSSGLIRFECLPLINQVDIELRQLEKEEKSTCQDKR